MENKKNNNVLIALLFVIIVILLALVILLATETISFKFNDTNNNLNENNNQDNAITNLTNETATTIVRDIMDKFYSEVFYGHKETYCGEYDRNDVISGEAYNYYKSATYNTLNDLKAHLNTYMSSNLVDYMLGGNDEPKYKEKDNKLYCLVWGRGGLAYNKDNSSYSVLNYTNSTITATANVAAYAEGNTPSSVTATLGFNKINDVWLLSTYEEK